MNDPADRARFLRMLEVCAATFNESMGDLRLEGYWLALKDLPLEAVERSLSELLRSSKFFPKPAEIRETITAHDGHLGPEEAWALVATIGEEATVVWTDEIAEAWGVARPLLDDRVAARMAFLETYRRQLAQARHDGRGPGWWVSLGWDVGGRSGPILDAVARGRLQVDQARGMLPLAEWSEDWAPSRALPPGNAVNAP